jgi:hypothetical protein
MDDMFYYIHHLIHLIQHINAKRKKIVLFIFVLFTCEQNNQPDHSRFRQYGTAHLNVNHSNKSTINPTIIPVINNINTPKNRSTDKSRF